jgi:hypothetical protein
MSDPIDKAIARTDGAPAWPPMVEVPVLIASTNRPAVLLVPADVSALEVDELCAWALLNLRAEAHRAAAPSSRLVVARGVVDR